MIERSLFIEENNAGFFSDPLRGMQDRGGLWVQAGSVAVPVVLRTPYLYWWGHFGSVEAPAGCCVNPVFFGEDVAVDLVAEV